MSLDQNLFTLNIRPLVDSPLNLELVDNEGNVHYRKERTQEPDTVYEFQVIGELLSDLSCFISRSHQCFSC